MSEILERYLTIQEVASRTGQHPETVRRAIRAGRLAAYRIPKNTRVTEEAFQDYIRSYHCPAHATTSRISNYDAGNGASSGGKKESGSDFRQVLRTRRALARR